MGPIGCPETSLRNYNYSLRKDPEERSSIHVSKLHSISLHVSAEPCGTQCCLIPVNTLLVKSFLFQNPNNFQYILKDMTKMQLRVDGCVSLSWCVICF